MSSSSISTEDATYRRYITINGVPMAYVDVGHGDPIVFLHGNPTPSYLWRNIIPHALPFGRCLAPDYPGMGNSGAEPNGAYRLFDQQHYVDGWIDALGLERDIILVVHDWGSALGFDWARRNPGKVKAIVYMEGIVRPFRSWDEWPELTRAFFEGQRSPAGEKMILEQNLFVEYLLPLRGLSGEAMEVYRSHYRVPGEFPPANADLDARSADWRRTGGCRRDRRCLRSLALDKPGPQALHQRRPQRVPDWRSARVLP